MKRCVHCGEKFIPKGRPSRAKKARYCSRSCAGRAKSKGGVNFRSADGRWVVGLRDGSRQLYARALMECYLGRHLESYEVVHHINHNRTDDRIENLALTTRWAHPSEHGMEIRDGIRRSGRAALTVEKVGEILASDERGVDLAARYGVSQALISLIRHRRVWNDVEPAVAA